VTLSYSISLIYTQFNYDIFGQGEMNPGQLTAITGCIMASISIIFAGIVFVMIVFCDQIVVITNRQSVMENVKLYDNKLGKEVKRRACVNFKYIFG
jgi:hypothetical protein